MKRYVKATVDTDMSNKIADIWDAILRNAGFTQEQVHLFNYQEAQKVEKLLESAFKRNNIDLSYTSAFVTLNNGRELKVAGNPGSIAWYLIRDAIKSGWKEVTDFDLEMATKIYEEDKYGYCEPISINRANDLLGIKTGFEFHGWGSQAYQDEYKRAVYEDAEGNIKIDITVLRWD